MPTTDNRTVNREEDQEDIDNPCSFSKVFSLHYFSFTLIWLKVAEMYVSVAEQNLKIYMNLISNVFKLEVMITVQDDAF